MDPKRTLAALSALALSPCALAQTQAPTPHPERVETLPPIVVTGKNPIQPAKKELLAEQAATPGAVTVVDGEDLKQRNITSLTDALRYVPGLWAASGSTGDSSFLSMRGSNLDATNYDGNGIKLMVDGLPVTAADGNNHNRDVDPLSARYVVVARGANALAYGASTLGGAIDFITPTARDGAPNEVRLSGGSFGERQARATLGGLSGAFDGLVTVEGKRSDGYRQHHKQERTGLYANAGLQLNGSVKTRFYATAIDNEQQLPGALTRAEFNANPRQGQGDAIRGDYAYNVKTWRLANKITWQIDADSSLTAGLSHERQQLFHPIVYGQFFSLLIDTEQRNTGASLRYQRKAGSHDLLAGLNIGRTTVTGGNRAYTPGTWQTTLTTRLGHEADNVEAFVMDRWAFAPGWTAVYGLQAVKGDREIRATTVSSNVVRNPKGDYDALNPRIGLIRALSPSTQLFANLSRLFEAPTLYELEDEVSGNNTVLEPMKGTVVEVGTRGKQAEGPHTWHWEAALYHARLQDEILSKDGAPLFPGTSQSLNVDGTVHAGIEALVGASLALDGTGTHRIEPLLSLTLNHFRFKGDATYGNGTLPAAPSHVLKGEVLYRHASGFFAGPTFDVVGKRWADFKNTSQVDGYQIWGLRTGYASKRWELWAEARNLTDKHYVSQFSVKDKADANDAILTPGAPRSFYVGTRLLF